jgi:hypothetical protein
MAMFFRTHSLPSVRFAGIHLSGLCIAGPCIAHDFSRVVTEGSGGETQLKTIALFSQYASSGYARSPVTWGMRQVGVVRHTTQPKVAWKSVLSAVSGRVLVLRSHAEYSIPHRNCSAASADADSALSDAVLALAICCNPSNFPMNL